MPIDKKDFFQSKYEYYKDFSFWVIVFSCLASVSYFISDCQLFGRFATETVIPRGMSLIPTIIYAIVYFKVKSYKIMVPLCYVVLHCIMWNTIWAIVYLPNKDFAREGFIIMHLMFFAIGFCAPLKYAIVAHSLLIADILISNTFNHYESLDLMLSLGIPCVVAICFAHYFMQKLNTTHYLTARKLEHISTYDTLTDVYNRNILEYIIEPDTLLFKREMGKDISILLFDIDFFKQVNDTYGHVAGDRILKSVVDSVRNVLTRDSYFIRWGGEEFVIILPHCPLDKATDIAEALRVAVENSNNDICPTTISIGIAPYNGINYKSAIDKADKALYAAKGKGRNCIHVSSL